MCLLAFTACNERKTSTTEVADDNDTVLAANKVSEEEAITETDDEGDGWENEVWTAFGGTYFFFGDGEQYIVDFPLGEDVIHSATLAFGDEELTADVNPKTGLITACDEEGKEVFRGAIYAGGNLLKGTYRGKQIKVWGSGD